MKCRPHFCRGKGSEQVGVGGVVGENDKPQGICGGQYKIVLSS